MMICAYCGKDAPDNPHQSCCGEIHFVEAEECPSCGSLDVLLCHVEATGAVPECNFLRCQECGEEWGQDLTARYFAWNTKRKYNRYIDSRLDKGMVELMRQCQDETANVKLTGVPPTGGSEK